MKASTYKAFKKLNRKVDELTEQVRKLTQQSEDRAAAKKLTTDVQEHGKALTDAVASSPRPA